MLRKLKLLVSSFILLTWGQIKGQEKQEIYADLASKIDSIVSGNEFNGVISVSIDSTIIYSKATGYSNLETKKKLKLDDQFVIGSISKQITAVLVLREFEKRNLKLNDPINTYLTKINQDWSEKITIHHLLTHTHGIFDLEKPLEFKEGSRFKYSQLGYELLAEILQKVTGKTFQKLSTEFFLEYGLVNTFHPQNTKYDNLVKGYEENESGILAFSTNSLDNYVPAGGFISNIVDLKKWNQLLFSGQFVTKETLALMSTKYATRIHPIFETIGYGYGLLFKDGEENIEIGALGYTPGFVSASYFYPQTKINVIVLENTARYLDNFKQTFLVHTEVMDALKKVSRQQN
ncbi:serine hydrolase domain-containing protein [Zobellia roscoffensis]|uniref:serine hydrolase domain-containing protein n=1 Tax=Zobellia roscoffensis TaxID=2779508 RepID=UPI00188DA7A0|nr:serine hydrolase domain-containing protein [Zobellia roscoffensis]